MASTRLTFVLDGRDGLTPVMRRAGESADDFQRRLQRAASGSSDNIRTFTQDADGRLRQLNGRFLTTADAARVTQGALGGARRSTADWSAVADGASAVGERLTASLISLAPAAIPAAASLAPIAAGAGAAGIAIAAFAGALIPQISALTEAAEAEKKYDDAVTKSGRASQQAITAQLAYQKVMADLPPETRKAAVALGLLKDAGKAWSDSLSGDTMPVFTKGLAIANALLPKTTGLVKGTSVELDRMVTLIGGGMQTPGFDRVNAKFTAFATGTLHKVSDSLVQLMRTMDTGKVGGGLSEFMDYARAQGPLVADTMRSIGEALVHVLTASSDVGVSMLQVVNALAGIVAAVPPGAITALLQLAIAIKAVRLAAAGMLAARAAVAAFGASLVAMRVAAAAAPGRLAAVTAAIGTLSRGAKLALAGTGIGLLVIAISELSQGGKDAAPDVDKLTTSLARFGSSGKLTGEAASLLGKDLGKLKDTLGEVLDPSYAESFNNWGSKLSGGLLSPGDAGEKLKSSLDAVDDSLAGLVSSGRADVAAAALQNLLKGMNPEQVDKIKDSLGDYNDALANAAFEQKLAAQSQGLFGAQAQQVQTKLDAQKRSADGLRQSIQALNDVNRAGLGGMIGFEAAIDAATKAAKDNAGALDMTNGKLNLNSEKSRNAASALNDLAAKTDEATGAARESGASWSTVNGIYSRGRQKLIESAQAMGLTKTEAKKLADQILKTPDKTAKLKGNLEDLESKLRSAKSQLARVPDSRKAKVKASIADLELKIRTAKEKLAAIDGSSATTYIKTVYSPPGHTGPGGIPKYASGGMVGFPTGGHVRGPGSGRSDSIVARLSNGEYVMPAAQVAEYGVGFFDALRAGQLGTAKRAGTAAMASVPSPRPVAGRSAATAQVVRPVTVNIDARGAMDPVAVGRELQKVLVKFGRAQGSTVDLNLR